MAKNLYTKRDEIRSEEDSFVNGLEEEKYRTSFRKDYARLIHSPSFRRLQGKTQLFPGVESDFFRNRLTHSLEVAQVAKSIAIRINALYDKSGKKVPINKSSSSFGINCDLVEFAGLAHDLGHPPFGHQGEEALDKCMIKHGGFEGNAQTIRVLSKIEKKFYQENSGFKNDKDCRIGLNLTMRSLASILKYDNRIELTEENRKTQEEKQSGQSYNIKPVKGYYYCDEELINQIKESVLPKGKSKTESFKTVECYIMDIADDIAYSTYDLEDGMKAGFITPLDLIYPSPELLRKVVEKVNKNLKKENIDKVLTNLDVIEKVRADLFNFGESELTQDYSDKDKGLHFTEFVNINAGNQFRTSKLLCKNGSIRTGHTSNFVGRFVRGAELVYNAEYPALSKVILKEETRILVEILKTFTYMSQITSPRLKIAEYRGKEIVTFLFNTLNNEDGYKLLPEDVQEVYELASGDYKQRVICDFIASMTDRYAIEFYGRLTSENPETIFKPF